MRGCVAAGDALLCSLGCGDNAVSLSYALAVGCRSNAQPKKQTVPTTVRGHSGVPWVPLVCTRCWQRACIAMPTLQRTKANGQESMQPAGTVDHLLFSPPPRTLCVDTLSHVLAAMLPCTTLLLVICCSRRHHARSVLTHCHTCSPRPCFRAPRYCW